jgi:hypothetical protein
MSEIIEKEFGTIIRHLIGSDKNEKPLARINISGQFCPEDNSDEAIARNLNAAFLVALAGEPHPHYEKAKNYLMSFQSHSSWGTISRFLQTGLEVICSEITNACCADVKFEKRVGQLSAWLADASNLSNRMETLEKVRGVFFPEGLSLCPDRDEKIKELREKRKVRITKLNPNPIRNPIREILFTSNILLTLPQQSKSIDELQLSPPIKEALKEISEEEQVFWYDHPIQMGVDRKSNEALYGVQGLEEALEFEHRRGKKEEDKTLDCVLSVSVTHKGLHRIAKEYLQEEFRNAKALEHLTLYVFTETETSGLIEEILVPAGEKYLSDFDRSLLRRIIGVDGEYGRHYSFLKAIAVFWHVFIDSQIKGTFKIDLDQVFPQEELLEESGASAFEHLSTPLWGAEGTDVQGEAVSLGMVAGALVNERDIHKSLFTPDVCFPPEEAQGDDWIFLSPLPQALSTEAEMMTRYTGNDLNGKDQCIQRVHVTGGTCGVLIESLKHYRPFTPTFIGRAEDQAYILSVLFADAEKNLRYVHKDGLIMRHDKEAFAGEAIKTAYMGKVVGDYARILWFTYYARALPWDVERIKSLIDPFTGCFVSSIPFTVVFLRLAFKAAAFFASNEPEGYQKGFELLGMGSQRLRNIVKTVNKDPNPLVEKYLQEKRGWDMYYDILEHLEKGLREGESFALELQQKAKTLVKDCTIT